MSKNFNRRQVLKGMGAACAAYLLPAKKGAADADIQILGQAVEVQLTSVSRHTFRLSILPVEEGKPARIPSNG